MLALLHHCAKISGRFYQGLHKVHVQYTVPYIVFARYVELHLQSYTPTLLQRKYNSLLRSASGDHSNKHLTKHCDLVTILYIVGVACLVVWLYVTGRSHIVTLVTAVNMACIRVTAP